MWFGDKNQETNTSNTYILVPHQLIDKSESEGETNDENSSEQSSSSEEEEEEGGEGGGEGGDGGGEEEEEEMTPLECKHFVPKRVADFSVIEGASYRIQVEDTFDDCCHSVETTGKNTIEYYLILWLTQIFIINVLFFSCLFVRWWPMHDLHLRSSGRWA